MFAYKIIVNGHNVPFRKGVDMTIDRMIALMDAVIAFAGTDDVELVTKITKYE